jgi:hypothetical protein
MFQVWPSITQRQSTFFVADDQGNITELSISTLPAHIQHQWKIPDNINWKIKDHSVDWLYNRLYMILENNGTKRSDHAKWQVARCGFDGRQHSVVLTEMNLKPFHIEVDPFDGFLVWTIQHPTVGGLYRVDLADLKQDHPLTFNWSANGGSPIQRIIKHHHLGAFTVGHINSRILAIDPSNNKVLSIQSGRVDEWEVIRSNVSHVENVTHMSHLDEIFYWVNNVRRLLPTVVSIDRVHLTTNIKQGKWITVLASIRRCDVLFSSGKFHFVPFPSPSFSCTPHVCRVLCILISFSVIHDAMYSRHRHLRLLILLTSILLSSVARFFICFAVGMT